LNQRKSQPPKNANEIVQILSGNTPNQTNTGFNANSTSNNPSSNAKTVASTPSKENEKKKDSQIPPKNANEIVQILLENALKE
ncbi:hypothetical protein, partial [Helicobacter pylori]|uniref:hypothetical protein n=1 Tax=Helicobacter pylori TaxID=210 RepID=UPI0016809BB5